MGVCVFLLVTFGGMLSPKLKRSLHARENGCHLNYDRREIKCEGYYKKEHLIQQKNIL